MINSNQLYQSCATLINRLLKRKHNKINSWAWRRRKILNMLSSDVNDLVRWHSVQFLNRTGHESDSRSSFKYDFYSSPYLLHWLYSNAQGVHRSVVRMAKQWVKMEFNFRIDVDASSKIDAISSCELATAWCEWEKKVSAHFCINCNLRVLGFANVIEN